MKPKRLLSGFTLVELVTVIGLLGALSLIALAFNTNALWKGRNSRRISEMEQLRNALEAYRADHSTVGYPTSANDLMTLGYIRSVPPGPQDLGYSYVLQPSGFEYCLCAPMEGDQLSDFPASECSDISPSYTVPNPSVYTMYCVAN